MRLFKKSNPVLLEWLVSPVVYMRYGSLRDRLLEIAPDMFSRKSCAYHYLRMAENNYRREIQDRETVRLKKYFYVLRPLINIQWLKENNSIPPMSFVEACSGLGLPDDINNCVDELLAKKKVTKELGRDSRIPVLDEFIGKMLKDAEEYCGSAVVGNVSVEVLNQFFREIIIESWTT